MPGPGQESVWDYPRPPALVADDRLVRVELEGVVIAKSHHTLRALETSHPPTFYVPREDVDMSRLQQVDGTSRCEWKGEASYFDVVVGQTGRERAAWSYNSPFGEFEPVAGLLCFYASLLDCFVDDIQARPQPGRFYGGWITPELVGPFKGEPGSSGW